MGDWVSASSSVLVRVRRFLRRNLWAIPILGFQILLVSCAVLLASGLSEVAEGVADVAYFMLLFGVVSAFVVFWRRKDGE